ncbi:MAG: TauD/TfdA family dioxygenase, partial [Acidobacteria bacterium]|nr:TauD/TfdA family dioxygenase [Acidobacteriota bacterium]
WQWLDNGLRTEQRCPAVATHPKTGEKVFFNQIQLHHVYCLGEEVRESMRELYSEEQMPRNVYFGDGSAIPDAVMARVGELYDQLSVEFPWQQGDILMVDNMLVAHARNAYRGAGRRIAVVMGDMVDQAAVVH